MQIVRHPGPATVPDQGAAVTIGVFDGLHLGHRAVIGLVKEIASERGLLSAVVTFDRHPALVVRPTSAPMLLTDLDQKLELLEDTGIDVVVVVTFDDLRSQESPEDFVSEVLVDRLATRAVIVGEDFHFGHQRRGNVPLLRELGDELGFTVEGIELIALDDEPGTDRVSSTAVRRLLAEGDVAGAARLLGRSHEVRGIVAHGDKRGRELGFPTANVSVPGEILLPADGIYAGWYLRPDGVQHPTAMSIGRRPTFYEQAHASLLECYLIDFDGDLYDEPAKVRFVERLRGEERFDSVDALIEQMRRDVDAATTILTGV